MLIVHIRCPGKQTNHAINEIHVATNLLESSSDILHLLASRWVFSVFPRDFSPDMNFHDMCVSPCSPVTDYDDDQLLGRMETKILCPPGISFHTLVSAVFAEMEPFVYLGDLVRMMISSRHYFNSEIEHKASLYKHWVTEWDMVLEDRVVERWENETWSDCEDDVKGLPELIACPCSFCCEISKVRKWPSLLYEDLYSVHDIQPP